MVSHILNFYFIIRLRTFVYRTGVGSFLEKFSFLFPSQVLVEPQAIGLCQVFYCNVYDRDTAVAPVATAQEKPLPHCRFRASATHSTSKFRSRGRKIVISSFRSSSSSLYETPSSTEGMRCALVERIPRVTLQSRGRKTVISSSLSSSASLYKESPSANAIRCKRYRARNREQYRELDRNRKRLRRKDAGYRAKENSLARFRRIVKSVYENQRLRETS